MTVMPADTGTRERLAAVLAARADAVAWRCPNPDCDGRPHPGREWRHARGAQQPPWGTRHADGTPVTRWYLRGGRGSGKTWAGARALAEIALWYGGTDDEGDRREYGVVGPTHAYTKETLMEGGSGLITALGGEDGPHIEKYNRTTGTLHLANGAVIYSAGADNQGKGVEGKNLTAVWCDEVGLWGLRRWRYTYEQAIQFALRKHPGLWVFTGTPKQGHPMVRMLVEDESVVTVVMATRDNTALDAATISRYEALYAGTRIGRQELDGEVLSDTPGALWTAALLEEHRWARVPDPEDLVRIVIGWDPAVTSGENADEHGIVVAAQVAGDPTHIVVLEDVSGRYTPLGACQVVADTYSKWGADAVVAEVNNGQEFVTALLRTGAPTVPVATVNASRGKRLRAEPVAALTEQGRLHLVGAFPTLEDQMTSWTPEAPGSPDRLDALVWAVTHLTEKAATSRAYIGRRRINVAGGRK